MAWMVQDALVRCQELLTREGVTREDWHNDPMYGTEVSPGIVALSMGYTKYMVRTYKTY
jgi:hypothetical protein